MNMTKRLMNIAAVILSALILVNSFPMSVFASEETDSGETTEVITDPPSEKLPGDINGDGKANIDGAILLFKYVCRLAETNAR